jgi:hypothetical protein
VLKYAAFDEGINVTLGLPVIRTSVDHGTALDLAGTGKADRRPACSRRSMRQSTWRAGAARERASGPGYCAQALRPELPGPPGIIRKIVDAIAPRAGDTVVEIGPGWGRLPNRCWNASTTCTWSRSIATSSRACAAAFLPSG